jgi:hypothetical protein
VKKNALSKLVRGIICVALFAGCRTQGYDRIPATTVENPDPLLGGAVKLRPDAPVADAAPASTTPNHGSANASNSTNVAASPTAQRQQTPPDRIGPLTATPPLAARTPVEINTSSISPGTASLTLGVREPQSIADQNVQPASSFIPAAHPELVQGYRKQLSDRGAVGLRTKQLEAAKWEAMAHFPATGQGNQFRRIEAQGTTEADALLAIVEQLDVKK